MSQDEKMICIQMYPDVSSIFKIWFSTSEHVIIATPPLVLELGCRAIRLPLWDTKKWYPTKKTQNCFGNTYFWDNIYGPATHAHCMYVDIYVHNNMYHAFIHTVGPPEP